MQSDTKSACFVLSSYTWERWRQRGGGFAVAKEEKGREGVGVTESREIVEGWMGESKTKQPFL